MEWKYALGTQLVKSPGYNIEGDNGANTPARVYYFIKCFYLSDDMNEEPFNFTKAILPEGESPTELVTHINLMKETFSNKIYDMDNFPNFYIE